MEIADALNVVLNNIYTYCERSIHDYHKKLYENTNIPSTFKALKFNHYLIDNIYNCFPYLTEYVV